MPEKYIDLITYLVFFLYVIDIGVEFNTAYYLHGSLIKNKKKIAIYYLHTFFFYDLIAVGQFNYHFSGF